MIEKEISFRNRSGRKLSGILHIPDGKGPFPAVAVCHGFKRDKNQIIPLVLSRNLSVNGFVALRFDFQNCGQSEGDFEDLTITQEIEDAYSAIDCLEGLDIADKSRIGIAGLSMGGGVAIIAAANDRRIRSLVAFSPLLRFSDIITKHISKAEIDLWKNKGVMEYYDKGRERYWKLKIAFMESCFEADATPFAEKISVPSLLVHGDNDSRVPFEENKAFFERIRSKKEILMIRDCDHQYRQVDGLHKAVSRATGWFRGSL